jgi:hypothetical protein
MMASNNMDLIELSALKPRHFTEIMTWDHDTPQSFFRFRNPLKITTENLGLMLTDKSGFYQVAIDKATQKPLCVLALTGFHQVDQRGNFSVGFDQNHLPDIKLLDKALFLFFQMVFNKLKLQKIQIFLLGLETNLEKSLVRLGAQ